MALDRFKTKNPPRTGFWFYLHRKLSSEGPILSEAVTALELAYPVRVGLKRQFVNFTAALRASPASLIHLSLKAAALIRISSRHFAPVILKRHFAFLFFVTFTRNTKQNSVPQNANFDS